MVTAEVTSSSTLSDDTTTTIVEEDIEESNIDHTDEQQETAAPEESIDTIAQSPVPNTTASPSSVTPDNEESPVCMISTACGDYHNLGLDTAGQAYSLPSPLHFSSIPGGAQQKVTEVVCGKVRRAVLAAAVGSQPHTVAGALHAVDRARAGLQLGRRVQGSAWPRHCD